VSAADVGQELGQEVAATMRRVPEVMMRIYDRQFRLQRCLGRTFRQPRLQVGVLAISQAWVFASGVARLAIFPSPWFIPAATLGTGDEARQDRGVLGGQTERGSRIDEPDVSTLQ